MANDNKNRAVVTPVLGSGILGAGAYGSYKFDNLVDSLGLSRGLTLNPRAVRDIERFSNLKLRPSGDPVEHFFNYARLGNRAASARLFKEDPRAAWEWFTNNHKLLKNTSDLSFDMARGIYGFRAGRLQKMKHALTNVVGADRANKIFSYIDKKLYRLQGNVHGLAGFLESLPEKLKRARGATAKNRVAAVAAHEAEIGSSGGNAIVRLLSESALDNNGRRSLESLANRTATALYDYNKVKGGFKSPLEYFNYLYGNKGREFNPNMYSRYMKFFDPLLADKGISSKKDMLREVRKILVPSVDGTKPITRKVRKPITELIRVLGGPGAWKIDEATGNLVSIGNKLRRPVGASPYQLRAAIEKSPLLTFMAADIGSRYSAPEFGKMVGVLKKIQLLRSPKLRWALGLGSLGLGGLGVSNFIKNRKGK